MIKITTLKQEQINKCIQIADQQLGQGYFKKDELSKALKNNHYFCLIALQENNTIGFAYGYIDTSQSILNKKTLGIIKTAAIDEHHKNKGVATSLIREICKKIKEKTQTIVAIAWQNKDKINAQKLLENAGFKKDIEIKKYWHQESIKKKFICPTCGNPCYCSAILFIHQ